MPRAEAVSDTSPILNLSLVGRLGLLDEQFSRVLVPGQVWDELAAGSEGLEGLRDLRRDGLIEVIEVGEDDLFMELSEDLDAGEAAAVGMIISGPGLPPGRKLS